MKVRTVISLLDTHHVSHLQQCFVQVFAHAPLLAFSESYRRIKNKPQHAKREPFVTLSIWGYGVMQIYQAMVEIVWAWDER